MAESAAATRVIVTECVGDNVLIVRIDRTTVHNALNAAVLQGLDDAVRGAAADPRIRAVVLTGTGTKAFSAGADLDELAGLDGHAALRVLRAGQQVMRSLEESAVPVIAAVNGLALGGGFELVLACTFPVLAEHAELGLPEAGLGLMPGYGGTQRLARRVGSAVAAHAMLTGQRMTANRAFELGITPLQPVPADRTLDVALEAAAAVAGRGPRATQAILTALRCGADAPLAVGLELESALAALATAGAEASEGVAAFLEKRRPRFPDIAHRAEAR